MIYWSGRGQNAFEGRQAELRKVARTRIDALTRSAKHRIERSSVAAQEHLAYDGGGPAKGGTVTLYVDGEPFGEGRVEATVPLVYSGDETADIGRDGASPVSDDYTGETSSFTGTVNWVQIDIDEAAADADHLISPEERLRIAMARQ